MKTSTERVKAFRARQRLQLGNIEYKRQQTLAKQEERAAKRKIKLDKLSANEKTALDKMIDMFRDVALETFQEKRQGLTIKEIAPRVQQKLIALNNASNCDELVAAISVASEGRAKPASIKQSVDKIGLLYRRMFDKPFDCRRESMVFLDDTKRVLDFIAGHARWKSAETKAGMVNAITSILRRLPEHAASYDIYREINTATRLRLNEQREENLLSDEQKALILPFAEIKSKLADIDNKTDDGKFERALYGLFTLIPPRRSGTYYDLRIDDRDRFGNYFIVDNETNMRPITLVLNRYKTAKKYGEYRVDLPARLQSILQEYFLNEGFKIGSSAFPTKKGTQYTAGSFSSLVSRTFKKYTGRKLGSTPLRISFASSVFEKQRSVAELKRIAAALGHSVPQMQLYNKIDLNDEKSTF